MVLSISEWRACAALGQHYSTQRKIRRGRDDGERLTADIVESARQYGRYGIRKIAHYCVRPTGRSTIGESRGSGGARG